MTKKPIRRYTVDGKPMTPVSAALNADHGPASYSRHVSASRAILSHSAAILPQCSFSISVLH